MKGSSCTTSIRYRLGGQPLWQPARELALHAGDLGEKTVGCFSLTTLVYPEVATFGSPPVRRGTLAVATCAGARRPGRLDAAERAPRARANLTPFLSVTEQTRPRLRSRAVRGRVLRACLFVSLGSNERKYARARLLNSECRPPTRCRLLVLAWSTGVSCSATCARG